MIYRGLPEEINQLFAPEKLPGYRWVFEEYRSHHHHPNVIVNHVVDQDRLRRRVAVAHLDMNRLTLLRPDRFELGKVPGMHHSNIQLNIPCLSL